MRRPRRRRRRRSPKSSRRARRTKTRATRRKSRRGRRKSPKKRRNKRFRVQSSELRVEGCHRAREPRERVLSRLPADERHVVDTAIAKAADAAETFVNDGIELAMNRFNAPEEREREPGNLKSEI